jgi:hypothetical protein
MSANALVTIDMVPGLAGMALGPLASCSSQVLAHHVAATPGGGGLPCWASLREAACLKAAAAEMERAFGGSLQGVEAVFA